MVKLLPGTAVWAKFDAYPFWPGRVASSEVTARLVEHKGFQGVGVLFFGDKMTYALIPEDKVVDFGKYFSKYKDGDKTPEFLKAIAMAQTNDLEADPPLIIKHRRPSEGIKKKEKESEENASEEKERASEEKENASEEKASEEKAGEEKASKEKESEENASEQKAAEENASKEKAAEEKVSDNAFGNTPGNTLDSTSANAQKKEPMQEITAQQPISEQSTTPVKTADKLTTDSTAEKACLDNQVELVNVKETNKSDLLQNHVEEAEVNEGVSDNPVNEGTCPIKSAGEIETTGAAGQAISPGVQISNMAATARSESLKDEQFTEMASKKAKLGEDKEEANE